MNTPKVITPGEKRGRLTYIGEAPPILRGDGRGKRRRITLRCDCGKTIVCDPFPWLAGRSQSCGCLRNEVHAKRLTTHGQRHTPLYASWASMKQRSTAGNAANAHGYQGVGRDPRWDTFEGFVANPPTTGRPFRPHLQLGRFADKGNYTPENTRWLTAAENQAEMLDRRKLRLPDGRFAVDVARENGVPTATWEDRYYTRGIPIEIAVRKADVPHDTDAVL